MKTKEELIDYLVFTEEFTEEELSKLTSFELLDTVLAWEGIIGFTQSILDFSRSAYEDNKIELLEDLPSITTLVLGNDNQIALILHTLEPNRKKANEILIDKLNAYLQTQLKDIKPFTSIEEVEESYEICSIKTQTLKP